MKIVIRLLIIKTLVVCLVSCANSQEKSQDNFRLVGKPCEGCEAIFEYGNKELNAIDTLPDFHEQGQKIKLVGTVYQKDGRTPAKDVILYIYHTDQNGIYPKKGDEKGWAKRHGYIRGWAETDSKGHYSFYTLKPGIYPNNSEPAHIHPVILEPNGKYYWLESYYFEGDGLLTDKEIHPDSPRGGSSGIMILTLEGNIRVGTRDFVLGMNIPGYD